MTETQPPETPPAGAPDTPEPAPDAPAPAPDAPEAPNEQTSGQ